MKLSSTITLALVCSVQAMNSVELCGCSFSEDTMYLVVENMGCSGTIPSLSALTRLEILDLTDNNFTGTLPTWQGLHKLRNVEVSNNRLTGTLPPWPTSVYRFTAANNSLSGSIPAWQSHHAFEQVNLSHNRLTGAIPDWADEFEEVNLSFNQLAATVPEWSPFVSSINLRQNQLEGTIPTWSYYLNSIVLAGNHFEGTIPTWNESLIDTADLSNNLLSGTIPPWGSRMKTIRLADNELSGTLPSVEQLRQLSVRSNQLTGTIPELGHSIRVVLSHNQFLGPLPCLLDNTRLIVFDASHNNLTGTLCSWPDGDYLGFFDVSHNLLSGTIPDWQRSVAMRAVNLAENNFHGAVPEFMVGYWDLLSFNLSHNALSQLPPVPLLASLSVSHNRFAHTMPDLSKVSHSVHASGNDWRCPLFDYSGVPRHDYASATCWCDDLLPPAMPRLWVVDADGVPVTMVPSFDPAVSDYMLLSPGGALRVSGVRQPCDQTYLDGSAVHRQHQEEWEEEVVLHSSARLEVVASNELGTTTYTLSLQLSVFE